MSQVQNRMRLKRKIRQELISKGVEGYHQTLLVDKCRTKVFSGQVVKEILEDWRTRNLVQKFLIKVNTSKKPITVWRATTLIIDGRL